VWNGHSQSEADLRFWYQVFTCVSLRFSFEASSMRSWTLRYFCLSKLCSSVFSWWSVNAVLALRVFFVLLLVPPLPLVLEPPWCCRGWPDNKPPPPAPLSDWPEPPAPPSDVAHVHSRFTLMSSGGSRWEKRCCNAHRFLLSTPSSAGNKKKSWKWIALYTSLPRKVWSLCVILSWDSDSISRPIVDINYISW